MSKATAAVDSRFALMASSVFEVLERLWGEHVDYLRQERTRAIDLRYAGMPLRVFEEGKADEWLEEHGRL